MKNDEFYPPEHFLDAVGVKPEDRDKPWTFETAPVLKLAAYEKELDELLMLIGELVFEEEDPRNWANECYVSDMSGLSDFGADQEELEKLSNRLGFAVSRDMLLHEICAMMRGPQA